MNLFRFFNALIITVSTAAERRETDTEYNERVMQEAEANGFTVLPILYGSDGLPYYPIHCLRRPFDTDKPILRKEVVMPKVSVEVHKNLQTGTDWNVGQTDEGTVWTAADHDRSVGAALTKEQVAICLQKKIPQETAERLLYLWYYSDKTVIEIAAELSRGERTIFNYATYLGLSKRNEVKKQ
jgi:hypothetical protein